MSRDSKSHGELVLSAIIPGRRDLLDRAIRNLTVDHFTDGVHKLLFVVLEKYVNISHAVLSAESLKDELSKTKANAGKAALVVETFEMLNEKETSEADFNWSLHQLRDLYSERATARALRETQDILNGTVDNNGVEIKGQEAARSHMTIKLTEIERNSHMQEAPEGNVLDESDDILKDYQFRKKLNEQGLSNGILFGLPKLDEAIGGLRNGALNLMAAWTGAGKTHLCVQLAWSASVEQGKNFAFFTTETVRDEVRRRLVARHSRLPKFGSEFGLDSSKLDRGTLNREEESLFEAVVADLRDKRNEYGRWEILQVQRDAGLGYIESRATELQRHFSVDLAIMDYLYLLKSKTKRIGTREEKLEILTDAKQLAVTFNNGMGIPFVSPWQVSRTSWKEAQSAGRYTLDALAETSEAEKSSDVIISLLEPTERDGKIIPITGQVLKNRSGIVDDHIPLYVDYSTSHFSQAGGSELDNMFKQ